MLELMYLIAMDNSQWKLKALSVHMVRYSLRLATQFSSWEMLIGEQLFNMFTKNYVAKIVPCDITQGRKARNYIFILVDNYKYITLGSIVP
jgi:hypothetical protein